MKNLLFLLFICFSVSSCSVFYGTNYDNSKKVQKLQIGMPKEDAIAIMGTNYIIESSSEEEDGILEIIKYYSHSDVPYLLHFLNGELVLFNRYYPPYVPQHNITITKQNE